MIPKDNLGHKPTVKYTVKRSFLGEGDRRWKNMLGAQPHSNFMTNSGPEDRKYKRDSLFMSIMIAVPNLRSPVKVLISEFICWWYENRM